MHKGRFFLVRRGWCVFFTAALILLYAQEAAFADQNTLPIVQHFMQEVFAQKTDAEVRRFFEEKVSTLPNVQARIQALTLLAGYEHLRDNYHYAVAYYQQAAALEVTERKAELLLDAVREALCGCDYDTAHRLLSDTAAFITTDMNNQYYRRAAVYTIWLLLAENRTDKALSLITAYIQNEAFKEYHPALLFTLWWVTGHENIQQKLSTQYPSSIEAAAVNGNVTVHPSSFWYLMPKSSSFQTENEEQTALQPTADWQQEAVQTTKSVKDSSADKMRTKPLYYQLGFYKTKRYAQAMVADLQKKHFTPEIKEEIRPSGTLYFVVLVKENADSTMGLLLKNAGYEAFPVFP